MAEEVKEILEEEIDEEEEQFNPKVRWCIPQRLEAMCFLGKEVLAVAHDLYIVFMNMRTGVETVYWANDTQHGDGVDVVAGHKAMMFCFAEKVKNARIFMVTFPSFQIVAELKDNDVNRYKGLCLLEGDLVAGYSGFPSYLMSVWSWRTGQRLLSLPTGVIRRRQVFLASRTHMIVSQCYGEGLTVWEVAPCFRRCFVMRRAKEEPTAWGVCDPPLISIAYTNEGNLYAIDDQGKLYSVASNGISMVTAVEWEQEIEGKFKPCLCALGNGLLIFGPDSNFRWLKKIENKWGVVWKHALEQPEDPVLRLVGSAGSEMLAAWTDSGRVFRVTAPAAPDDDRADIRLLAYKQRNVVRVKLFAPDYKHVVTMNTSNEMCIFEVNTSKLVLRKRIHGTDMLFQTSPVEPVLAVFGAVGQNYGVALLAWDAARRDLRLAASACLTHQQVSRVVFSPTGREIVATAMAAGHIFIYKVTTAYKLVFVRYSEIGRGLADTLLMKVGDTMRAFALVLFSDKYLIGERIICINAVTGKDNKFAGKMQGPYQKLLPLTAKDTMLAIPHLSRQFHILKLSGEKGVTVAVKMGPIIDSGHELKNFGGTRCLNALLTFGNDGQVILRRPDEPSQLEFKITCSHRFEHGGVKYAAVDSANKFIVHHAHNKTLAITYRNGLRAELKDDVRHEALPPELFEDTGNIIEIFDRYEKNYLDLQEEKKVREEALDYKSQREEVVRTFEILQNKLVELLEENINEIPLHQLSLSEFNLHLENKKERLKQAEKEREEIRLSTEARIRGQDKVTAWIKATCWDTMLTPRVKILAIFSHYQVENYPVLPTQRDRWPELMQTQALRTIEMEEDANLFRPWEEMKAVPSVTENKMVGGSTGSLLTADARSSEQQRDIAEEEEAPEREPHVLSGTSTHKYITVHPTMIPQTLAFSYLQMAWLTHLTKLNVQHMRLWFNKQFDDLMGQKKREVGLVAERNTRLRFIIEELNKLSDLRGSFHHLMIVIKDPEWRQEEEPIKLTKVEVEECTIPPYLSHIIIPPPELGPKDDFRERALNEMMDGVLEKLWHEEIKKPIPKPQCMLDKDPEHWNEEDLRQVFDYEAKVTFRNEERDKYRKMLHAEYAKLSQTLNEGVVKFNMKVKDLWLTKLKVDSVIGQENLNLMRLRRENLDRLEASERLEDLRAQIVKYEQEAEVLQGELTLIMEQSNECQTAYDALAQKDRQMDRTFKNHFADLSPIIVDQCYKFFKKRPKWHQRASMTPVVLYELAAAILSGTRPPLLHPDCVDYFKAVEQLDAITNMPAVMNEALWATMCRLRRTKIENEIRMRGFILETAYVDNATKTWSGALSARRSFLVQSAARMQHHRESVHAEAVNRTLQLVLPAGQVEIVTTGHLEDFDDATLLPREDVEMINQLILRVGAIKLRLMRRQIEFRKGILAKEWEHAQMKMKLRHMQQELYTYGRLKIVKELQWFLKNKEKGYTDEHDYARLEKEMAANKMSIERVLQDSAARCEEVQVKISNCNAASASLDKLIDTLTVKVSEKRLNEDALEPIRIRRIFKRRMETLVARSRLIREVQANHTRIVLLQTELELLRLKTFPTLASFTTFC